MGDKMATDNANTPTQQIEAAKKPDDLPIRAIVGLGNPGRKYAETRHNVGWLVIEALAFKAGGTWSAKFNGEFSKLRLGSLDVWALKPGTFMNLSGHPTQAMCAFYGVQAGEVLVIHDDLDLPFGRVQIKSGGGHGGHNGLRSLVAQLGSAAFVRVRVGVGRPSGGKGSDNDVADHVLAPFSPSERAELPRIVELARDAVLAVLEKGVRAAMNQVNAPQK